MISMNDEITKLEVLSELHALIIKATRLTEADANNHNQLLIDSGYNSAVTTVLNVLSNYELEIN